MNKPIEAYIGKYEEDIDFHGHLVTIKYSVPFFMATATREVEGKEQTEVFYSSYSENNGFKDMKMHQVIKKDFVTIFFEKMEKEGNNYRDAFRYLLNIQGVANRMINDVKQMYGNKKVTRNQAIFINEQMQILLKRNREVLRSQKTILEKMGYDVTLLGTTNKQPSKVCQKIRIARALRLLKLIKKI